MTTFRPRFGLGAAPLLLLAACSSPADDSSAPTGQAYDSSSDSPGGEDDEATGAADVDASSSSDDGDEPDTSGTTTGGAPPPPSAGFPVCPDELPTGWVLCEDFEGIDDPAKSFFEFQGGDGAFVLGTGDAASGERSMRTKHRAGVEGSGWLSVAIGRNPVVYGDRPNAAADGNFQEIYWRFRVKTQAGWPDIGLGHLTSATVLASSEWTQAMVARLRSDGDNVVLLAEPTSCIEGESVSCAGFDDAMGQKNLGGLVGAKPIFASAAADEWHCVEAHVVLNTPGDSDGVFEFWVDDELENGAYTLDWRGSWDAYGINLVTLENFWPGGAPVDLERAIDDLVISTAPIGCD
jgi:hypothetical protein